MVSRSTTGQCVHAVTPDSGMARQAAQDYRHAATRMIGPHKALAEHNHVYWAACRGEYSKIGAENMCALSG
jgi:hypothetical protein